MTVDVAVFALGEAGVEVLLIRRGREPYKGCWALPGGFIEEEETLEESARRELLEETGVEVEKIVFCGVYGDPGRDPRGRSVTAAYYTVADKAKVRPVGGDDADEARWFPASGLPEFAFDHDRIVPDALARLRLDVEAGLWGEAARRAGWLRRRG